MAELRATAIMKTDICGSTTRFRTLSEDDLMALLQEHRVLLAVNAGAHGGRIVKEEGDGAWLLFPSVTAAARAAIAIQEELQLAQPGKEDDRLAMRIVITLGDTLIGEADIIGDNVVLAARMEAITPPDEIYLSLAAYLALNQAEVRAAYVDTFSFKGFADPVTVYRLEQTHRVRVITRGFAVVLDLRGFARFVKEESISTVEKMLEALFRLTTRVTAEFSGTVRVSSGDSYLVSFAEGKPAVEFAQRLWEYWEEFIEQEGLPCSVNIAVHQGTMYAYRSFLYGPGLEVAADVQVQSKGLLAPWEGAVFVTGAVRESLEATDWETRFTRVAISPARDPSVEVYRLEGRAKGIPATEGSDRPET